VFAQKYHLTIVERSSARRTVVVMGRINDFEEAFQVHLSNYINDEGVVYRNRVGSVHIPANLDGVIEGVKEIIITENGSYFKDELKNGVVNDVERIDYFRTHLQSVLKAKNEGVNIKGYFAWTLMDNFEWTEGFNARFGLIHVDFETQLRTIKNSGYWFRDFLTV